MQGPGLHSTKKKKSQLCIINFLHFPKKGEFKNIYNYRPSFYLHIMIPKCMCLEWGTYLPIRHSYPSNEFHLWVIHYMRSLIHSASLILKLLFQLCRWENRIRVVAWFARVVNVTAKSQTHVWDQAPRLAACWFFITTVSTTHSALPGVKALRQATKYCRIHNALAELHSEYSASNRTQPQVWLHVFFF
jgi:hypothetical protein